MNTTSVYGSIWRLWDLHVHSPASALNNQFPGATPEEKWEKYIAYLEGLTGVGALGITDYCSIEGYLRVADERKRGRITNIPFVFPNIELRILPVTRDENAINIHVLACPSIADELETMLLAELQFEYNGNTYRCTRDDLIRLGRAVSRDHKLPEPSAYQTGVLQFKTDIRQIRKALRSNQALRDNCLIVVPNRSGDGNSGRQEHSLAATREEIYRLAHAIFSSNPRDRDYFLGKGVDSPEVVIEKCGGLMPCIHGSDAHCLEKIAQPDGNRYTWIKADATFEGLKQICFEPEYRVEISAEKPLEPFHLIDHVTITIPIEAQIGSDLYSDQFCWAGDHTIYFAPGFTCLIGGRGSGKSTLINILKESLRGNSTFFRDNAIRINGKSVDIKAYVKTHVVGSPEAVEFLTQNEIEQFALNQERLTAAIYSRLKRLDAEDKLAEAEEAIKEEIRKIDRLIRLIQEERELARRLASIGEELATNEHLIRSLQDETYVSLTEEARTVANEQSALKSARMTLRQLLDRVEQSIVSEESRTVPLAGHYEEVRRALVEDVHAAIRKARSMANVNEPDAREDELSRRANELAGKLQSYLAERNISPENVRDISRASSLIAELQELKLETQRQFEENRRLQEQIVLSDDVVAMYENILVGQIEPVNSRLQEMGGEVQRISLEYSFDRDAAREALLLELIDLLAAYNEGGRAPRFDHISGVLEGLDVLQPPAQDKFLDAIRDAKSATKTVQLVVDYFADPYNYNAFVLRARRVVSDVGRFRRLSVLYDGKPLQKASFGQRCSAALILLLTLGNTPIVIDEPEAHLDSALIANLLVQLIKHIKNSRQVIFATHNANFVVNGDADLIHILEMDANRRTTIQSTTLENLDNRPRILALEGGKQAFQQREQRYGFRSKLA